MRVNYTSSKRSGALPSEPITTADMKAFLRVTDSDEDTLIDSLVSAARSHVERYTGRALITQTWQVKFKTLPLEKVVWFPTQSVIGITSVNYLDENLASQALASSYYNVVAGDDGGIYMKDLPDIGEHPEAYEITYTAGYGANASDIPSDLLLAIKMIVESTFTNRDGMASSGQLGLKVPDWILTLTAPYRIAVI